MVNYDVDILVVGGGLTGASLVLALAGLGFRIKLVETKSFHDHLQNNLDARSLTLSPASVNILQMLKVWPLLQDLVTPIETIHVSERHCFGVTRLQGSISNPLGYVIDINHINTALYQLLDKHMIMAPACLTAVDANTGAATITADGVNSLVRAKLIIAADGTNSSVRALCGLEPQIKDYNQYALAANIGLLKSHKQCAYERFTTTGPLALLPSTGNRSSLVWALPADESEAMMKMSDSEFLNNLQTVFGFRLGKLASVGRRILYPLKQVIMPQQVTGKIVFIGNAAHTLHPVAGQGFNLGLRDAAMLAQCISQSGLTEEMLQLYQKSRRQDQKAIACFTDGLIELFLSNFPGIKIARSLGLVAMDNITVLKKILSRYAQGYAGIIPDLVCGIDLQAKDIHE